MVKLTNLVHVRRRVILDVGLSRLCFLLAMMLRLGWSGACENGEILLVNLLVFSGVCATVYLMTSHSFRSWRFVFMPDIVVMMRDIMIAGFIMIITLGGTRVLYRSLVKGSLPPRFKDLLRTEPVRRHRNFHQLCDAMRPSILRGR